MAALTNTMGSMYSNAMKGVAADAASEKARRAGLSTAGKLIPVSGFIDGKLALD